MTKSIHVPKDIGSAQVRLGAIDGLLVATEWEKAAIVAAFVEVTVQGGDRAKSGFTYCSPVEFAKLGINGLKSDQTVRRYAQAWQASGHPAPKPGDNVELPTAPFSEKAPAASGGYNGGTGRKPTAKEAARTVERVEVAQVEDMVKEMSPEAKAVVVKALAKDDFVATSKAVSDSEPAKDMIRRVKEQAAKKAAVPVAVTGAVEANELALLALEVFPYLQSLTDKLSKRGMTDDCATAMGGYADQIIGLMNEVKAQIGGGVAALSADEFDEQLASIMDGA